MAIAWSGVFSSVIASVVNAWPNKKLINYGYLEQIRDLLPCMLLSLVMFFVVHAMNALALPTVVLLALQMLAGAAVYGGLAILFKLESAQFLLQAAGRLRKR